MVTVSSLLRVHNSQNMVKRIVLEVDISCPKCKKKLMRAISGLEGVDKIEADAAKNTLTVIGDADPIEVITCTRKVGKFAQVLSIGPTPPPLKPDIQKKPEPKSREKKSEPPKGLIHTPLACPVCQQMSVNESNLSCSIM